MAKANFKVDSVQYNVNLKIRISIGDIEYTSKVWCAIFLANDDSVKLEVIDWEDDMICYHGIEITELTKLRKFMDFHASMGIHLVEHMQEQVDALTLKQVLKLTGLTMKQLIT